MKRKALASLAFLISWFASDAQAQKNLGDVYKDPDNAFQIRLPQKWTQIPVQSTAKNVIGRFTGPRVDINMGKDGEPNTVYYDQPELRILQILPKPTGSGPDPEDKDGEGEKPGEDGDSPEEARRKLKEMEEARVAHSFEEWVKKYSGFTGVRYEGQAKKGKTGKYETTEYRFLAKGKLHDEHVYALVYHLEGRDLAFVFELDDSPNAFPKWVDLFEKSAETFKEDKKAAPTASKEDTNKAPAAEDERKKHQAEVAKIPGWYLDESKRYFLKAPAASKKFLEELKENVESLRSKLEEDFPSAKPIVKKGVIRVCADVYEYRNFTQRGDLSHGSWNPQSQELVTYDSSGKDAKSAQSGLCRSMLQQYLFYRNGEINVHPWFLEGMADYYGGARIKKGKIEVGPNDVIVDPQEPESHRLAKARALVRDGNARPLDKFLRLTPQEYRADGLNSFAQGWAFVYFLRQNGKGISGWQKEWGKILDTYLKIVVESRDPNRALEEALKGIDIAALEKAWSEFVKAL